MPWVLLALLGIAGYGYYAAPKKLRLQPGQVRLCFRPEFAKAALERLRINFQNVVDEGGGCFLVTVPDAITILAPEGFTRIAGDWLFDPSWFVESWYDKGWKYGKPVYTTPNKLPMRADKNLWRWDPNVPRWNFFA